MYEVASAHAAGVELLRINIKKDDAAGYKRATTALLKCLRSLKSSGMIQFFATAESFNTGSTEAQFLINKYPEQFELTPIESDECGFVYVRT